MTDRLMMRQQVDHLISAYAFAVSEQNADCGTIVTAPTCGACGILPAVLRYAQETNNFSDEKFCADWPRCLPAGKHEALFMVYDEGEICISPGKDRERIKKGC